LDGPPGNCGIASAWVLVLRSAWALERLALLGRAGLSGAVYSGVGAGGGMLAAEALPSWP